MSNNTNKNSPKNGQKKYGKNKKNSAGKKTPEKSGEIEPVRLSKIMAQRGLASRRQADRLIEAGHVLVDGVVINTLGTKIHPEAQIELSRLGEDWCARWMTVIMNKPVGIVSTQPEENDTPAWQLLEPRTAYEVEDRATVDAVCKKPWTLSVAGRLDKESRGLLVLTQDGRVAKAITGGKTFEKEYIVTTNKNASRDQAGSLRGMRTLEGERILPMQVDTLPDGRLRFILREGKKHHIRRACESVGLRVTDLQRIRVGPWRLADLPEGQWRIVDADELKRLQDPS